jgi:hypothetical protein
MTPAERIARIRAEVERRLAVAEVATPGPWFACSCGKCAQFGFNDGPIGSCVYDHPDVESPTLEKACDNAKAIAAGRTEYPQALRAILAVLELHCPWYVVEECGHDHAEGESGLRIETLEVGIVCEEGVRNTVCRACDTTDGEPREDTDEGEYPCATVLAIERALGLAEEGK